jgi:hypothetical protein
VTIYDTKFYYRVGLFLAVPTEAIIAAGQFVKMHQIKEKAKYWTGLKVIDPDRPEDCLYDQLNFQPNINLQSIPTKGWCPPSLSAGVAQQNTLYSQQSLLAQQGILGGNPLGQYGQPNPALSQRLHAAVQQQPPPNIPYSRPTLWGKIFGIL